MKTSSEFCCEEHAEQYKKETVGRLLEYAQPLHPSGPIDPIHRLAILAGEKAASEEEPSWQIQEFVALTLRHQTAPRKRVAPASPAPPRPHRPHGAGLEPRKIWNPSLIHLLPKDGPWSRWFPAEPALPIPTGRSLSDPARPRQPAATRAEAKSGLRRRSAQGLPAAALAMGTGIEPSGAAPPGRPTAPAPAAMGIPRMRAAGQVYYPRSAPVQGFARIAPALGFLPVSAGLAAAPAVSGGVALAGVVPAAWSPVPVCVQALPFAPLRRGTPSFLSLAAVPRGGPNGCSHRSSEVGLWTGLQPALRLPELPAARKFGRLGRAVTVAPLVGEARLLDALAVLPAARHLVPGAVAASSPAILHAPAPVEPPGAVLGAFESRHTIAPASLLVPALSASDATGRRLDLAAAVERPVSAVMPSASNTWSPAGGLALLQPANSSFSSPPAEAAPQRLCPEGPSRWLSATRLLTGFSCAWRGAGESSRQTAAAGSTSLANAVAGEAFRLTATAADMIVARAQAPVVAQAPVAPPRSAAAGLEPRRVALSLPPSSQLALTMPISAVAATIAPAASGTLVVLSPARSIYDPATRPFVEVRGTVPPAALTVVPSTGVTPAPAPDIPAAPLPAPELASGPPLGPLPAPAHRSLSLAGVASLEPTVPTATHLPAAAYPVLPAPDLSPNSPRAEAVPVDISLPLLAAATGHQPLATAEPLPSPPPHSISWTEVGPPAPSVPSDPAVLVPLPALAIELRRRELPPPLPARRTARIADRVGAEAAFGPGRRAPAPAPTTAPALLSPISRSIEPPVSSSLQPFRIPFAAPRAAEPLAAAEPVPRVDVTLARPTPVSPPSDDASVREALDTVQKTEPKRWAILSRAAWILWHDAVVPFLATRRGKFATALVLTVFSLFLGLRAPSGPLRGVARAAILPMAERSYFLSEEGFASGFGAWTNPAPLNLQDNGLVEIRDGLTLYRPSLRRADYEFSFTGTIRKSAIGWVVRASDPSNYYVCKLTWRGKGKEKRSVLVRYPVVNDSPAAPEKVVALPFGLEENKVYNLVLTVHGDRITTLIDGRGVDSFSDARLLTGGIGFLAGPGEQALVHSLAVSGNDDPTGRALAWMLGFGRFLGGKAFGS